MTKTEFETIVQATINRGTMFNTFISGAVRRAVRFFERNNNFPYMRGTESFLKDPAGAGDQLTNVVEMGRNLKRLSEVRRFTTGLLPISYTYLTGAPVGEVGALPDNILPDEYFTEYGVGVSGGAPQLLLKLVAGSFASAFTLEALVHRYTDYDAFDISLEHWLLTVGEGAVLAKAMVFMAPIVRQPEIMPLWEAVLQTELPTLLLAADEMDVDQHVQQMGYEGG